MILLVGGATMALLWRTRDRRAPLPAVPRPSTAPGVTLRIGLVPEQDIFKLRRSYLALAEYLSGKLGQPVEVVTLSSYDAALQDFQDRRIDGAFLGSLVALMAMDRFDARVLVKPQEPDGSSTYRGVIFVMEDSAIRALDDLKGRSIAMLRTTTAGSLFPIAEMMKRGMLLGDSAPRIVWQGTHDEVIQAVVGHKADVGAAKNLRLDAYRRAHPDQKFRLLATSEAMPNNALVIRKEVMDGAGRRLAEALLNMDKDVEGRAALDELGAARFIPCRAEEYGVLYDMIDAAGGAWERIGVAGPPPRRGPPATTREVVTP